MTDDLEDLLRELDTGAFYSWDHISPYRSDSELEIDIPTPWTNPADPFTLTQRADFIAMTQHAFIDRVPARMTELRTLRRSVPKRIQKIQRQIQDIQQRVASYAAHITTFRRLDDAFATIHAARGNLPEGLEMKDVGRKEMEHFPLYRLDASIFGQEVFFFADQSLLRVAAYGRLKQRKARRRQQRLDTTIFVATLRLRVLESVLERYELTGVVPQRVNPVDIKRQLEDATDVGGKMMGRPPKVSDETANYQEKRLAKIREVLKDASNWHESGTHRGRPKWTEIAMLLGAEHPNLFKGNNTFSLSDSAIRQIVGGAEIDLDAIRESIEIDPPHSRD